jgi:glutathione peroxidase
MNRRLPTLLLLCALGPACSGVSDGDATPTAEAAMSNLHAIHVTSLDGAPADLSRYKGQVLLVVNTASECGYTPQYEGLEKLYEGRKAKGLAVLGFPSNDFGGQEPGDAAQIKTFCTQNYGVTFPMFSKVVTKAGPDQSPVYAYLGAATGQLPQWNFAKYLVGKDGKPIAFYNSKVTPENPELLAAIDKALAAR